MTRTKYLKGECQHCGGHLEFPAETIGYTADCPHCGQPTELMLARPPEEPTVPRRWIVLSALAVAVLLVGLGVCLVGLKHFESVVAERKERAAALQPTNVAQKVPAEVPEDPIAKAGFQVSAPTTEKTPGSSLVYAVGTVTNRANRQRFGVRIELELLDANGQKAGTATDYQQVMEAHAEWRFKALVVDAKAVTAKVTSVTEQQ
jgi:hypothetical protein